MRCFNLNLKFNLSNFFPILDGIHMHEWRVATIAAEQDSRMVKLAIEEVKRQQAKYRDYQAWYFQPTEEAEFDRIDKYDSDKQQHYQNRNTYGY